MVISHPSSLIRTSGETNFMILVLYGLDRLDFLGGAIHTSIWKPTCAWTSGDCDSPCPQNFWILSHCIKLGHFVCLPLRPSFYDIPSGKVEKCSINELRIAFSGFWISRYALIGSPIWFSFRLILAMDPRYGEISRAMRNRGVEIFMLGEVRF